MSGNIGKNIKRLTDISQKAIGVLLGLILASFMTIIFLQIIGQYLNFSIWWSEEISRYLFLWLIMLGVNISIYKRDMLRLEILDTKLPKKAREVTDLVVDTLSLIFISVLLYCSILYIKDLGPNQIAPTLRIQMRYVVFCVPIGMILCIWTQLLVIIGRISELLNRNQDGKGGVDTCQ